MFSLFKTAIQWTTHWSQQLHLTFPSVTHQVWDSVSLSIKGDPPNPLYRVALKIRWDGGWNALIMRPIYINASDSWWAPIKAIYFSMSFIEKDLKNEKRGQSNSKFETKEKIVSTLNFINNLWITKVYWVVHMKGGGRGISNYPALENFKPLAIKGDLHYCSGLVDTSSVSWK